MLQEQSEKEKKKREWVKCSAGLSLLGRTLEEAKQQVDGFQALATRLATGHAHLPLPDVVQRQVDENLVVSQHLLEYLET